MIFKAFVFGIIIGKLDKDIVVEVVNQDGIGSGGKLSDMIVHKLPNLRFVRALLDLIEDNRDELFVEFFIADFDLINDVDEKVLFRIVKNVS